jgi:hypothetical protein
MDLTHIVADPGTTKSTASFSILLQPHEQPSIKQNKLRYRKMDNHSIPSDVTGQTVREGGPGGPDAVPEFSPHEGPLFQHNTAEHAELNGAAAAPEASQSRFAEQMRQPLPFPSFSVLVPDGADAVYGGATRDPDGLTAERLVHHIDESNLATTHHETADDTVEPGQELINQQVPAPEQPAQLRLPDFGNLDSIQEVLESITPEQQAILQGFFTNMNNAFLELANNPHRPPFTAEEIHQHFGDFQEVDDTMEALDSFHRARLEEFISDLEEALIRLNSQPRRSPARVQQVSDLLDRLSNDPIASSLSSDNSDNDSCKCSICLAYYVPGDLNVILPCHTSHQFHRNCIEVGISPSLNLTETEALTCSYFLPLTPCRIGSLITSAVHSAECPLTFPTYAAQQAELLP